MISAGVTVMGSLGLWKEPQSPSPDQSSESEPRIIELRDAGMSHLAIVQLLAGEGLFNPRTGHPWNKTGVRDVCRRASVSNDKEAA
jgi:hypothetical protein